MPRNSLSGRASSPSCHAATKSSIWWIMTSPARHSSTKLDINRPALLRLLDELAGHRIHCAEMGPSPVVDLDVPVGPVPLVETFSVGTSPALTPAERAQVLHLVQKAWVWSGNRRHG